MRWHNFYIIQGVLIYVNKFKLFPKLYLIVISHNYNNNRLI